MLSVNEYLTGLYGAARLALFKPDGMRAFKRDPHTAIRSFGTLLLFIPLWAWLNWPKSMEPLEKIGLTMGTYLSFVCLQYVIAMLIQLLVTRAFAYRLGVLGNFPVYVTANNWTALLSVALTIVLYSLGNHLLAPDSSAIRFYSIAIQAALLAYSWFVVTTSLRLPPQKALGIILLQYLLYICVQQVMAHWMATSLSWESVT